MVFPDFQPMRMAKEPVCIFFGQNLVFTSLHLRSPVHFFIFCTPARAGTTAKQEHPSESRKVPKAEVVCTVRSIIIKAHGITIVLQDYSFYLLVFFLSLLLFTVPRCKIIVLKHSRIFLLVSLQFLKTVGGYGFYLLVLQYVCQSNLSKHIIKICVYSSSPATLPPNPLMHTHTQIQQLKQGFFYLNTTLAPKAF